MFMPVITTAMPSRIWIPKALWIATEMARWPSLRTRRARMTSASTTTHAHQRWTKWVRNGSFTKVDSPCQLTLWGKTVPFISGQSVAA